MESIFKKVEEGVDAVFGNEKHSHSHFGYECEHLHPDEETVNRYHSFAPVTTGNAKWYVDGCSYFWAVSEAIERAREEIFILDWWLSPELYLRRPPSLNEQYRLDNMLKAAAERGVNVNIIVYREVEAALTCNSEHTRKALEALHPNISVFRHPDHTPTGYDLVKELGTSFTSLTNFELAKASDEALKALYGTADGMVLFWAHHEKLIVIDRKLSFMGGLDLCFGRWDTNSHPIADAHPGNLDAIVFPGQDYNNARVYDFHDVGNWNQNKLDRTKSSRMGWSDIALSMTGPIVDSTVIHFTERWNFIWKEKYRAKNEGKYSQLSARSINQSGEEDDSTFDHLTNKFNRGMSRLMHFGGGDDDNDDGRPSHGFDNHATKIQLTRSSCQWSSGQKVEHSIANAYIEAITNAEHFVYIENQFFITATCDKQLPVANKIGAAMVDRIVRAHEEGKPFRIWVVMPAVPAFAGDLESEGALGTRAIMEFQYFSISRGGHSIFEQLQKAGINPSDYIGFYNLRNYDRVNTSKTMHDAEERAGVSYEDARRGHDGYVGSGYADGQGEGDHTDEYRRYQREAGAVKDTTRDTISSCYMSDGPRVSELVWDGNPEDEINAFVSEELYVHSKLLIADDRLVICGSANLNDRSQLGTHDSEIAVIIEDPTPVESKMNGQPFTASAFAASLRRQIFRKHLGLLPDQPWDRPDQNWQPVDQSPNHYDWGSISDKLVQDPLHPNFQRLWAGTAKVNTETFSRAFHPVPNDHVRTWEDYKTFFTKHFIMPGVDKEGEKAHQEGKVEYGHIVPEEFPGGVAEVKEWLDQIRGTLVEMPLDFLVDVDDIAKEGLTLNSFTAELYT